MATATHSNLMTFEWMSNLWTPSVGSVFGRTIQTQSTLEDGSISVHFCARSCPVQISNVFCVFNQNQSIWFWFLRTKIDRSADTKSVTTKHTHTNLGPYTHTPWNGHMCHPTGVLINLLFPNTFDTLQCFPSSSSFLTWKVCCFKQAETKIECGMREHYCLKPWTVWIVNVFFTWIWMFEVWNNLSIDLVCLYLCIKAFFILIEDENKLTHRRFDNV